MGYNKLCLLLLLSCCAAAQDHKETSSCQLTSRFKLHKKYMYQYTAGSRNEVVGTANLQNGPKVSCQVEIEVPQMCKFIMHTRGCTLSEVSVMDPEGQPVYKPVPDSDAFRASMEKTPLKFHVDSETRVQVYPEADEAVNILNIKRGIVSAFMVPIMEKDQSRLVSTVHGRCLTSFTLKSTQNTPTDVTLSRDLSQCDQFHSRTLVNSPLALLQQLHNPMSKLITSTQSCSYQFNDKEAHIVSATCTERHIYRLFSHEGNGLSSVVTQDLSFQSVKRSDNRIFDAERHQARPLHFEDPEDKTPVQTKDAVLSTLQELVVLAGSDQGQKRTSLFHKLVSSMRALRNETLSQAVAEMVDVSRWLTFQALFQCGTPECTSAIMQVIWTTDEVGLEVDALVYGLSLQSSPDASRVRDMLSVAQHKQSKAIMYALANTVKKFHQGEVTPEVTDVSEFMELLLNSCSEEVQNSDSDSPPDPKEVVFLVLRVVGVMGRAMQDVSPSLVSSVLKCTKKTDIPLSNQKAAIQAFRLMGINDEIRNTLMEVFQDPQSPVEKRLAAYLVLMKNPDQALIRDIVNSLTNEREDQIMNFVVSHLKNLHSSDDQTPELKEAIELVLQTAPKNGVLDGLSQNNRIDSPLGSVQSNIIFNDRNTMPKEMTMEATLEAFDVNYDIFEVGVEGTGFEPTIDGLFGEKGFVPESVSRLVNFAGNRMPMFREFLDRISPRRDRMRREVPEDHLKAIRDGFQKHLNDVRFSPTPEATAYLRLLGAEIGYVKTSEMRQMFETLFMYYHFIRVLPAQAFFKLTSSTENEVFFHYIFMENAFCLPTSSGFPLRFSLSGVFAPGAKGGLTPSAMTHLSFMPSVGLEFITQMGVHIPDYVDAGIEMHTNMYHESSFNAKITVNRNQIKLSVPAPESSTQLFSVSNNLLSVSSGQTKIVPSLMEDRVDSTDCQPLFRGLNLCTIVRYSNATSVNQAPYYPLTGETKFGVEIQPTGTVSEYTATITDETLREGKKGRHKVESLKLTLRAEEEMNTLKTVDYIQPYKLGEESMEASASLKYNRNKNLISSEIIIPDYDVEASLNMALTDSDHNGKKSRGFTIDFTNKNIPQLSLVGRARHDMMKEAMLQLQMDIPVLKSEASITAVLKNDENVKLDLETVVHLPETLYQQRASLKQDNDKLELELKTDMNAEIKEMMPNAEDHYRQIQQLLDDFLDQRVTKTDMKLRHIVTKAIEAGDIWLDKLTARFPSLANLRSKRSRSDLTLPPLPERLFLQSNSLFRYQFNKDKMNFHLPLPLGGKKSEEMNFPKTLSVPIIDLPQIGLNIPAKKYVLPTFTVPPSVDITVPLLGLAEASTKIHSNFYNWEGSISGGNNTVDVPNYVVQYKAMAQSPLNLLSYKFEGAGMISGTADDHLKYLLNSYFSHILIDTSLSVLETLRVANKLNAKANYKIEASSILGLHAFLYYSAQSTSTLDSDEVLGDGTVDGLLKLGSFNTTASYTHSYNLRPLDREGRGESTLRFEAPFIQFQNMIQGVYANSELNIISKTSAQKDIFKHMAELKYKDTQLTLKCKAVGSAMGKFLNNQVELGISNDISIFRIESQVDDDTSRVYSLITGSLNSNELEVNSEGSLIFDVGRGLHKASVRVGKGGVIFGGMNSIQCSPVTMENIFNGVIDFNGASFSSTTKAMAEEGRGELNIEGKITSSEVSLDGVFKGHAYDASTTNNMNVILNRRALTFSGNTKGTLRQMKTENSYTLTLTLWTITLRSKMDTSTCEDIYYRQNTKVDVKPFVLGFNVTSDLKFYDLRLNKESLGKLEPVKLDLSGSLRGAYREEHNIEHTYELTYKDLSGSIKYSTSGNIMDAKLSQNCELEFAGFSLTSKCEAQLNSEPVRFDGTLRTIALPFSVSIDALVNSDGKINLYGKHAGQLYSKLLFKAAPLALAYSHDSQVSTTHRLRKGACSTSLGNKFEGLLTPNDQSLDWKVNSKLNNHAYEQDVRTYNNHERAGVEFSGGLLTDFLSRHKRSRPETQMFSVAGFLKYDKNSDCSIIEIPFIESFPAAFERLKNILLQGLESLQQLIMSLNINQLIADFRASLDQLPMHVKNFMRKMDFENKVTQVKVKLDYLINEFSVTMEDLEDVTSSLKQNLEINIIDIITKVRNYIFEVEEFIKEGHLTDKIESVISHIGDQLQAFDEKHEIKQSFVKALNVIEDVIGQIDLQKLEESSAAFLQVLDSKYGIMEMIKEKLSELKHFIEDFNMAHFLEGVKHYLLSIDWASFIEQFTYQIPALEIPKVMESMNEVIVNWIDEYEIPNKLNAVYSYFRDIIVKYELNNIFKDLMDQVVVLVKHWKIEETVQSVGEALKSIKFEILHNKIMDFLYSVTSTLRETDFNKSINDLNERISSMLETVKDFDYDEFVDKTNMRIVEMTNYVNDEIKKYEIVKKTEALRQFLREIQTSIYTYLDELKNTKVADALKRLKNVIDTAFYNDMKLKVQDILVDMRQRILGMDIREEIYIYLQRASESYRNMVILFSAQLNGLMEWIKNMTDKEVFNQVKQAVDGVLDQLKRAEIVVPTFVVPLTDLVIPGFTVNINKLQEISIPVRIIVPEITILGTYTIPAFTIDFNEVKAKIVAIIDDIQVFEIQAPDPEDIFGDLKVLYLSDLPDLTFPEIILSEIRFPVMNIPKSKLEDFEITVLTIPDIKLPKIPGDICIPVFGKLHGEFSITSPHYTLLTTAKMENSTSTLKNPQFTATVTSRARSPFEILEHVFEATARLEAPRMKKLQFTETMKATHMAFSVDHEGSLTLTGSSAEASAKTTTKATTQMYTADLINTVALSLKGGIYTVIDTTYNHNLVILSKEISSQASIKQSIAARMVSGTITVTGETSSNGQWSIQNFSDEGTHKSNLEFNVDFSSAKLRFEGETDCKTLKSRQTLTAESVVLSHITVEAKCEVESSSVKKSVTVLNGEAHVGDLKVSLTAFHDAEFMGVLIGTMSNLLEFKAHPFEIVIDVKNKVNSKVFLPLKLTGKVHLQHDYGVALNSEKQLAFWFALARFNQYKYSHNFTAENTEIDMYSQFLADGEANLDFLTVPLSIPNMTVPCLKIETPEVRDFSLWEDAGLKSLLLNPQQSFDMNLKLQYHKNPDVHSFKLHLEPIYNSVSDNAKTIQSQFEAYRDKVITYLTESYNEAKLQYIKHKIDTSSLPPRIFRVPGYKIPILNIQVSAFSAEMPAFSYFVPKEVSTPSFRVPALGFFVPSYILVLPSPKFPVIHVPETLSEIKLPSFTLPAVQDSIVVPAMGNITCDFSFKSTIMTVNANAGLYNQSDIVAQFGALSVSVFDILNGKLDSTTSMTRTRGLKLASSVSLEHNNVEANHECSFSLTKRIMEASMTNTVKINSPLLQMEVNQELTGNSKTKPHVSFKKNFMYMFAIPQIASVGKGNIDMNWELEALSPSLLLDTSTQGKSDITVGSLNFVGDLENKKNFYISVNNLRTTTSTALNLKLDKQDKQKLSLPNKLFSFGLTNDLALDASLRRVFATLDYISNNNVNLESFDTSGNHIVKGEIDFVPLTSFKTSLNTDVSQLTSLGHAGLVQSINLAISSEKQSFTWSRKEQLSSFIHVCDVIVFNNESEAGVKLTESVEGHLALLKTVKLPVYQRTLWDVLKFDEVTNINSFQFLTISSSLMYTKSFDNYEFQIPSKVFENDVTISVPEIRIPLGSWVKEIPQSVRNVDMRFESVKVPDHLTIPPVISVPAFGVPFTNLHVKPFVIDPKNLSIPKLFTTKAFDVTLPSLPVMSVPSYDINMEYLQGHMLVRIPEHEIAVSSFALPKSFTIGGYTISLDDLTSQISNFQLPTIVIPKQKVEIPEITLHLPSSVVIPTFGALSTSLNISSNIYNVSSTASVNREGSDLLTSLSSSCASTMVFLKYDLTASAMVRYDKGTINLNGMGKLIHSDISVNWLHVLAQPLRTRRQISRGDSVSQESRHTLNIDVSSRTFADANFRFASRKDGITASVSSPSAGFLGLHLQRKSPSQLHGKLFGRYLSSPEKDTNAFTAKASLRNANKLVLQTSWNWDFFCDVIEGLKNRIPETTNALLKFINKYHTSHFGFDLNRGGVKLKNAVSNLIESVHRGVSVLFTTLQDLIQTFADQGKDVYTKVSDRLMSTDLQEFSDTLVLEVTASFRNIQNRIEVFLEPFIEFLENKKFSLPGSGRELSIIAIIQEAHQSASEAFDGASRQFFRLLEKISAYIRSIGFNVPGTDVLVNGHELMDNLTAEINAANYHLRSYLRDKADLQAIAENTESLLTYLKAQNTELSPHVDAIFSEILRSSKQTTDEAQKYAADCKALLKLKLHEAYGVLSMERVNGGTQQFISVLQSNLSEALNESVDLMRKASQNTAPYIRVGKEKVDVEIPLPFQWKSFSEWPTRI